MRFRSLIPILLLALLPATVHAQALPTRLIQVSDIEYVSSFDLPGSSYGHGVIGFNPSNNSLYVVGFTPEQPVGEVRIPTSGAATLLQPYAHAVRAKFSQLLPGAEYRIGGLLPIGNQLIVSAYVYYDANGGAARSHYVRSTTLSSSTLSDAFRVGNASIPVGAVAGPMALIPPEWRASFGGADLFTGLCCIPIISRSSYGPSLAVARTSDVLKATNAPATWVLGYPEAHQTLGRWETTFGPTNLFNGTSGAGGYVAVPGTDSVIFFGGQGLGTFCYGTGPACKDPQYSDQGNHAYPYVSYYWAYKLSDLALVYAGKRQPWDLQPYAHGPLPSSISHNIAGVTSDPATGRIFVAEGRGEYNGDGVRVHVLRVRDVAGTPEPPPPAPVDCVGSWSQATRVSESACASGQRTLTWRRTFTIATPAAHGGAQCEAVHGAISTTTSTETCESSTPQPEPEPAPCECTPVPGPIGPAGPQGPRGERGETGATGPAGRDGTSVTLEQVRALIDRVLATLRIVRE